MSRITRFEESFKLESGSTVRYIYLRGGVESRWFVSASVDNSDWGAAPWGGFETLAAARNRVLANIEHEEQSERREPCELPPLRSE
jgi:hypothetical protein